MAGAAAQAAVLGPSQWRLLRARPDQRKVSVGQAVLKGDLAGGLRRERASQAATHSLPTAEGTLLYPGVQGATNWYAPSYSPRTGLFYLSVWADYYSVYQEGEAEYVPGRRFNGGNIRQPLAYGRNISRCFRTTRRGTGR